MDVPDRKQPKIPAGAKARDVTDSESSQYQRDTLPPSPEKARIIESAINKEVLTLLDAVGDDSESDDTATPSVPPPQKVPMEKIQEGIQYRIVQPATRLPEPRKQDETQVEDMAAIAARRKELEALEEDLREREERLLQREVVLGGREKILKKREEKLHQREVRLRNWEAKLMDKEAELRESYPPRRAAQDAPSTEAAPEPPPRVSEYKIEIGGTTGVWEMVEESLGEEGDGT